MSKVDESVLEEGVAVTAETVEAKPKKKKKVYSEEEVAALSNAVAVIVDSGVSPQAAKVLELTPMWHDIEANSAKKDEVAEFFGGVDKMKDYFDGDFQTELLALEAFQSVGSRLKLVNSFYKRREQSGTRVSKATRNINIDGKLFVINKAYYESIAEKTSEEKKELLLAHPQTKPFADDIESL